MTGQGAPVQRGGALTASLASSQQLLVPESTNDQVMLFDANDGSLINQNFIDLTAVGASTPIECLPGPDGLYISDQISDTVYKYSLDGSTFIGQIPTGPCAPSASRTAS